MTRAEAIIELKQCRETVKEAPERYPDTCGVVKKRLNALSFAIKNLEEEDKRIEKRKNIISIALFVALTIAGVLLTKLAMIEAEKVRGYIAIGGEIFILPMIYFFFYGVPYLMNDTKSAVQKGENDEAKSKKVSRNKKV